MVGVLNYCKVTSLAIARINCVDMLTAKLIFLSKSIIRILSSNKVSLLFLIYQRKSLLLPESDILKGNLKGMANYNACDQI